MAGIVHRIFTTRISNRLSHSTFPPFVSLYLNPNSRTHSTNSNPSFTHLSDTTETLTSPTPPPPAPQNINSRTRTPLEKQFESWVDKLKPGFTPSDVDEALCAQSDPDLALDIFRWTSQQRLYKHNHVTYLTMIKIAVSGKRYGHAETLIEEVIAGACDMASDSKNNEKKAVWDSRAHEVWVDCFVAEIDANNRLGTTLSKDGWKNMVTKFNATTGREYNKKQLKNHFDSTKTEWMLWNNLVNKETGLGWDNDKKIIIASDEWWEAKLKKYPNAAKFRGKGLEHCFKLDRIYQDVTATGTRAWAPTSGSVAPFFESYNDGDDDEVEKGSDSEENNAIADSPLGNVTGGSVSVGQSGSSKQGNKGKKITVATKLGKQIDRICDVAESRKRRDLEGCSKKEVVDRMATLPECELLSELYMFGTKLFMNRDYREMFVALPNDEVRLEWLKREQRDRQA